MSSASRRRRRALKRESHSREHAAEETLVRSEGGLAVCRSSIRANCTPAFNAGLGHYRALSLFTFPQPSTEKYRSLVTNNLDRGFGRRTMGLCVPIQSNPAPIPHSHYRTQSVPLNPPPRNRIGIKILPRSSKKIIDIYPLAFRCFRRPMEEFMS